MKPHVIELFLNARAAIVVYDSEGLLSIDGNHRDTIRLNDLAIANRSLRAELMLKGLSPLEEIKVLNQIDEIRDKGNFKSQPSE